MTGIPMGRRILNGLLFVLLLIFTAVFTIGYASYNYYDLLALIPLWHDDAALLCTVLGGTGILACAAGLVATRVKYTVPAEGEQPRAARDRIPLEAVLALHLLAAFTVLLLCDGAYQNLSFSAYFTVAGMEIAVGEGMVCGMVFALLLAVVCYQLLISLTVRIRWGRFWKNSLTYKAGHWLNPRLQSNYLPVVKEALRDTADSFKSFGGQVLNLLSRAGSYIYRKTGPRLRRLFSLVRKEYAVLGACLAGVAGYGFVAGYLLYNVWFGYYGNQIAVLCMFLLLHLGLFLLLAAIVIQLKALFTAAKKVSSGETGYTVDTRGFLPTLRSAGDNLNNIGSGMTAAIEERMRSERLKTNLITNVSHDIKTPLTSIISYIDLLEQEEMPSERAREYLAVLDRQAGRLKKLTEDLVEASKAAAGVLPVTLAPTLVEEILGQSLGEYQDRLDEQRLETILQIPEGLAVQADGRHLWRVFDNLLSNICKYAQPGTRVYIAAEQTGQGVEITVKNISARPLGISADELMERFVRGDAARSTEGSGLGLSIAQSLMDLQQGRFSLNVDGDLFKTVMCLPAAI